jgi:hypothetical protein
LFVFFLLFSCFCLVFLVLSCLFFCLALPLCWLLRLVLLALSCHVLFYCMLYVNMSVLLFYVWTNFYLPPCIKQTMSILKFFSRPGEQAEVVVGVQTSPSPYFEPPSLPPSTEEIENELVDEKIRKRKLKAHAKFATAVKTATGLDLKPAPAMSGRSASLCASCFTGSTTTSCVIRNVLARWINHAKSCPGLVKTVTLAPEAQRFVLQCMAGGDKHRRITCDAYIATYWVYKHKLPFTTSPKLKEVFYPNPSMT